MAEDQQRRYCWASSLLPKRPREREFEHSGHAFQRLGTRSADFIINPDWVSEGMNKTPPFGERRYRPWSYEFQGARLWPYGTVESREREEAEYRHVVDSAPVELALEPRSLTQQERWNLYTPTRFVALPSQTPWRTDSVRGCPSRLDAAPTPPCRDQGYFEKVVTGTDLLFAGNAQSNASRYGSDAEMGRYVSEYGSGGHVSSYLPELMSNRQQPSYMNFANCEWIR